MRRGVEQAEHRLHPGPGDHLVEVRPHGAELIHPHLDVRALQPPDAGPILGGGGGEVAVLHPDELGLGEREVDVEGEQRVQPALGPRPPPVEQTLADAGEHLPEHRLLAGEVPVQGGPADPRRGPQVVDADAVVPTLGHQPGRHPEQLFAPGDAHLVRLAVANSSES